MKQSNAGDDGETEEFDHCWCIDPFFVCSLPSLKSTQSGISLLSQAVIVIGLHRVRCAFTFSDLQWRCHPICPHVIHFDSAPRWWSCWCEKNLSADIPPHFLVMCCLHQQHYLVLCCLHQQHPPYRCWDVLFTTPPPFWSLLSTPSIVQTTMPVPRQMSRTSLIHPFVFFMKCSKASVNSIEYLWYFSDSWWPWIHASCTYLCISLYGWWITEFCLWLNPLTKKNLLMPAGKKSANICWTLTV